MKNRYWKKICVFLVAGVLSVCFMVPHINMVSAENTPSAITLLSGIEFNEALKTLAKDSASEGTDSVPLYQEEDSVITGFERSAVMNAEAVRVDLNGDGSITAWLEGTTVKWYSEAATIYLNVDCSYMFYGLSALTDVKDLDVFNASRTENLSYLFCKDSSLQVLDLTVWDVSSLNNMEYAFADMTSLSSLNINNWDPMNMQNMNSILMNDSALKTVDLSSFTIDKDNTSIVDAFTGSGLERINVGYGWSRDMTEDTRYVRVFTAWFNQTLVMASDTELSDITFSYDLVSGDALSGSSESADIKAGLMNEHCCITDASFTASDPTTAGTPVDSAFEGKKYMTKKVKILIDTAQFSEPGIYRYIVRESTSLEGVDSGLFALDESNERVLDVLVEYQDDEDLKVSTSVFHKTQTELLGQTLEVDEKSTGFDNSYLLTTNDLIIRNSVSGNQGDSRRGYTYTFVVDGEIADRKLTVVHNDGSVEYISIDANQHGEFTFTLKGSEHITIKDIQKRSKYTVTSEKEVLKETGLDVKVMSTNSTSAYTPAVCFSLDDEESCYATNLSVNEDVDITFLNIKDGIVPTGIIIDTAPYTLSFMIGLVGIVILCRKKKQEDAEEQYSENE